MNLQLSELEVFFAAVETGSFSAASRKLGMTPSAVSKLVSRLEDRLGVRLFNRTPKALTLTDAGAVLRQEGQAIFDALANAENAVKQHSNAVGGLLRVHSIVTFAKYQLAPITGEFLERYPHIRIEFHLSNDPVDLTEQGLDLSIRSGALPDSSLIARRLLMSPWTICGSPAYLARHGTPRVPADLLQHNCLNFTHRTHWNTWPLVDNGRDATIEASGNAGANHGDMLLELAKSGVGLVRLGQFHIGEELRAGSLVPLLTEYDGSQPEPLYVLYQSRKHLNPRTTAFLDFLDEKFGRVAPG
jgi:DNA-binding transcriptional LysR family regulator